jgi:hypothetical protein
VQNHSTIAEQIAARLGDNGQRWQTTDGTTLEDLCMGAGASLRCLEFDFYAYDFADGSTITVAGAAWDLGYAGCYCWQGVGHETDGSARCTALPPRE